MKQTKLNTTNSNYLSQAPKLDVGNSPKPPVQNRRNHHSSVRRNKNRRIRQNESNPQNNRTQPLS